MKCEIFAYVFGLATLNRSHKIALIFPKENQYQLQMSTPKKLILVTSRVVCIPYLSLPDKEYKLVYVLPTAIINGDQYVIGTHISLAPHVYFHLKM